MMSAHCEQPPSAATGHAFSEKNTATTPFFAEYGVRIESASRARLWRCFGVTLYRLQCQKIQAINRMRRPFAIEITIPLSLEYWKRMRLIKTTKIST